MSTVTAEPTVTKVALAGIGYGKKPDMLETLLGSCVGVCIYDRSTGLGSLAHVVLSDSRGHQGTPGKFADTAIEEMRRQLVSGGANPLTMTAKIAGGATMFGKKSSRDVGAANVKAVKAELEKHNIRLIAEHVGGERGRIIRFSLKDASVAVSTEGKLAATI
ncbi:MAG: chemotaxis protein CheD [Planctomycetes bacterium]|nr:chemotaxis protein CheD [Planctomycetota bacterium]